MPPNKGRGRAALWLLGHVNYRGDDCLRWPFSVDTALGRGRLGYLGKNYWAHRLMCELAHGPAPLGKPQVRHSCGRGHERCVNPKHLSWASQSENHLDRRRHGTAATSRYGSRSPLTREQIAEIRASKGRETQMATAKRFGISHANVRRWQGTTHEPAPPGTSPSAIKRRNLRAADRFG